MEDQANGVERKRKAQKLATREQILAAATELLKSDGYAALRVAAVATAARVSLGGLLHHFPSKELLVIAVLERLSDKVFGVGERDAARDTEGADILDLIARSAHRFYATPEFLVYLDIFLSVRRGTPVGEAAAKLLLTQREATENLWLPHLTARGVGTEDARRIIRALWALARGMAISSGSQRGIADSRTSELVIDALRRTYFRGSAATAQRDPPRDGR